MKTPLQIAKEKVDAYSFSAECANGCVKVVSAETAFDLEKTIGAHAFTIEIMKACLDLERAEKNRLNKIIGILVAQGKLSENDFENATAIYNITNS